MTSGPPNLLQPASLGGGEEEWGELNSLRMTPNNVIGVIGFMSLITDTFKITASDFVREQFKSSQSFMYWYKQILHFKQIQAIIKKRN